MNKEKVITMLLKEGQESSGVISNETPFKVGESYLIRTVTHIDVGECAGVQGGFIILKNAS